MVTTRGLLLLGSVALLLAAGDPARAAPQPMSPDAIITLAQSGVGYSYWWGGACWRTDGTQLGSCSGSCPSCTHTGDYGADCSGFVGKVWQVPDPSPVEQNWHPYSTSSFRWNTTHWDPVPRDDAQRADAAVYRNASDSGGHIVLYESGDPWGSVWVYECRGCSYGCVHNLRTLSDSYIIIRRHNLDGSVTPREGTLTGVVFVDRGQGFADMSERIPGATVEVDDGPSTTAGEPDAAWSFSLEAGTYTVTASADGFGPTSRTCTVVADETTWCSLGLPPETCTPDCSGRECGPDPDCGLSCGTCTPPEACSPGGRCDCEADCDGRECGPDPVCGESCGTCTEPAICGPDGRCDCTPDCSGRECGPDPACGESCGTCPPPLTCDLSGRCICLPDCSSWECGPDPVCGVSCGTCRPDERCDAGTCVEEPCTPTCGLRECGPDPSCGQSCGVCPAGEVCDATGTCRVQECTPACGSRECGPDPVCGESCGTCADGEVCDAAGNCRPDDPETPRLYGVVVAPPTGEDDPDLASCPPVANARVWLDDDTFRDTGADGAFEFLLAPGTYVVRAAGGDGLYGETSCTVDADDPTPCYVAVTDGVESSEVKGGCAVGGGGLGLAAALLGIVYALRRTRRR